MGLFKFIKIITVYFSVLSLMSCSTQHVITQQTPEIYFDSVTSSRAPANVTRDLDYYLAVDRFHYYLGEFINFHRDKASFEVVNALKKISPKMILAQDFSFSQISDANKFDELIHRLLDRKFPDVPYSKQDLVWNYNFLKRKLNENYSLKATKENSITKYADHIVDTDDVLEQIELTDLNPQNQTLDSGHYISNRTTRGVFWEAIDSNRTVEFHLGDAREFLKNIQKQNGKVLYEVRPVAANYNKIYVVQYPGESTFRIAVTNVGGKDRLQHLVHQFGLSNIFGKQLRNKVVVYGDIDDFHEKLAKKFTAQIELLPKADRLFLGQKGAIETMFLINWKLRALKNLYDDNLTQFKSKVPNADDIIEIFEKIDSPNYSVFDHKKAIETAYDKNKAFFEKSSYLPGRFKQYTLDATTAEMSDFVFENANGKTVRWRVVSNVWGDEIVPLAKALKATGHKDIVYIGTAGVFPDKGYKVGDMVMPSHVSDAAGKMKSRIHSMFQSLPFVKSGGTVDHVASPFDETWAWFNKKKSKVDFVEIETSYLRRIFNGVQDKLTNFLMISDILGAEGETLASASSSKRKSNLNKLLMTMLKRDKAVFPNTVVEEFSNDMSKIRFAIEQAIPNRSAAFKYYVYSVLKEEGGSVDVNRASQVAKSLDSFTDAYHSKRLVEASEGLSYIVREIGQSLPIPNVGIERSFINGKWHPKNDKLRVKLYAASNEMLEAYQAIVDTYDEPLGDMSRFLELEVVRGPPEDDFVKIKPSMQIDQDFLVKVFAESGYSNFGLEYDITYSGNIKYSYLPTEKPKKVCGAAKFCTLSYFEPDQKTRELLDELGNLGQSQSSLRQRLTEFMDNISDEISDIAQDEDFEAKAELKIVNSLEEGKLAKIEPVMSNNGLVVRLTITKEGLKNPMVVAEEMAHMSQIAGGYFQHPMFWAEITLNAKHGSRRSQLALAKAEVDAADMVLDKMWSELDITETEALIKYSQARKASAEKIVKSLKKEVSAENKARKAMGLQWKTLQTNLEKANLKLDDYIAANNRKKVAELIRTYMPWEEMEPTEIAAWQRWLKAMEVKSSSVPNSRKVLYFRGLEGDHVKFTPDGKPYLMSMLLQKNQGNYTRRLRSLKTFRKKLSPKAAGEIPSEPYSLANVLKAHSHEPFGSPFMSASTYNIAEDFSGYSDEGGMAAIYIDKNRVISNLISDYDEAERLIPMILFPDEIAHYQNGTSFQDDKAAFVRKVSQNIGRTVSSAELDGDELDELQATKRWWELVNPEGITPAKAGKTCKKILQLFAGQK